MLMPDRDCISSMAKKNELHGVCKQSETEGNEGGAMWDVFLLLLAHFPPRVHEEPFPYRIVCVYARQMVFQKRTESICCQSGPTDSSQILKKLET